jgi:diamine N-acetyltransferase
MTQSQLLDKVGVRIRTATQADLPAVQAIARSTWPVTFAGILTPEQIGQELAREYSLEALTSQMAQGETFLILESDEDVVAYASFSNSDIDLLTVANDPKYIPTIKMHKLYVLPSMHGKGYGKALMDWIERDAYVNAVKSLYVLVDRDNRATQFYSKLGFETVGELDTDYGHLISEDYVMVKILH